MTSCPDPIVFYFVHSDRTWQRTDVGGVVIAPRRNYRRSKRRSAGLSLVRVYRELSMTEAGQP